MEEKRKAREGGRGDHKISQSQSAESRRATPRGNQTRDGASGRSQVAAPGPGLLSCPAATPSEAAPRLEVNFVAPPAPPNSSPRLNTCPRIHHDESTILA